MNTNANKKTVSINTATRRTTAETFEKRRNTRLKKAIAAAKKGIDVGPSKMVYLSDALTTSERAAAVKAAMAASTFAYGPYKVTNVPVAAIAVESKYQRDPKKGEQLLTRETFDWAKFEAVVVSYRDGVLYAVDGGHRVKYAVDAGIETLPVKILEGKTLEQEARQFATQKDQVVTIKAAQRFKADVVSKDRTASIIYALCDSFGLTVTNKVQGTKAPMKAIVSAKKIVNNETIDGADCFCWMLSLMDEARWFEDRGMLVGALTDHVMKGFESVYIEGVREKALPEYTTRLLKELRQLSPKLIVSYGHLRDSSTMDKRGYTKGALVDIAKGVVDAQEIFRLAREAGDKVAIA